MLVISALIPFVAPIRPHSNHALTTDGLSSRATFITLHSSQSFGNVLFVAAPLLLYEP